MHEAHAQLARSEERWRSVVENSIIGVALTDLKGQFFATNPAYQAMLGYSDEELRQLRFLDGTLEEYRDYNWTLVEELLAGKRRHVRAGSTEMQLRPVPIRTNLVCHPIP